MAGLRMSVKGLPSTYSKNPQESFEPMLDGTKTVADSTEIATGVLATVRSFQKKDAGGARPG
ncbi:hypothetical protein GJ744_007338 [Endocarpon pusillum]|uniref:Uncharacterized protein n=1 Tax=Endocarpon pusillum TaxID=364733 RepID=A0A8H7AMW7_9EURO|nr:hypothetical protein GJ744_007338 [Endocarpon pusillum]